jgi:hypothetical protein
MKANLFLIKANHEQILWKKQKSHKPLNYDLYFTLQENDHLVAAKIPQEVLNSAKK